MKVSYGSLSIMISAGFYAYESEECLNIIPFERDAAINLSSAVRIDHSDVTEADIMNFVEREQLSGKTVESTNTRETTGFKVSGTDGDGIFWQRWFLRNGPTIAFVTYNAIERLPAEEIEVSEMVSSLEVAA